MHDDVADRRDRHQTVREALHDLAAHEAGRDARVQVLVLEDGDDEKVSCRINKYKIEENLLYLEV